MNEGSFNGDSLSKENFADIATEKICRILCFPGNDSLRTWAVRLLQKASRGFGLDNHEPWLNTLSTMESSKVILSSCKTSLLYNELAAPFIDTTLPLIIKCPLKFDFFIAELTTMFLDQIKTSQEGSPAHETHKTLDHGAFHVPNAGPSRIGDDVESKNNLRSVLENTVQQDENLKSNNERPSKRQKLMGRTQPVKICDIMDFLRHVWYWARQGKVNLEPTIIGDVLAHLSESVEEIVLSMVKEAMESNQREKNPMNPEESELPRCAASTTRDIFDNNENETLTSLSILQEFPIFLAAAATSPQLFQMSSSILNQLLIDSSGCLCSWSPILSLCTTFAQETAKGRADFYPLALQPLVLMMEMDPIIFSNGEGEAISKKFTFMCKNQPAECIIALLSHFPVWLPFLDHTLLLYNT